MRLITDLLVPPPIPILFHPDIQATLHISWNLVFHERTKHVELDCYFVCQQYLSGLISLSFVPSKDQIADIFTKSLVGPPHNQNLSKLGATSLPSNLMGDVRVENAHQNSWRILILTPILTKNKIKFQLQRPQGSVLELIKLLIHHTRVWTRESKLHQITTSKFNTDDKFGLIDKEWIGNPTTIQHVR